MANAQTGRASGAGFGPARLWTVAFVAALVLYVATLAPDLDWQDGGEFQWAVGRLTLWPELDSSWCIPHHAVRVHPWFLVTARALWWPRLWDYAYAANLCSAISMAFASANVVLLVDLMTRRRWAAVVAGLSFAVGHTIWTFAVMAEVLGWTAAFLSAECLCAWAWASHRQARWLLLLLFLNGVALSNHLMAAISLAVFGVWILAEIIRRRAPWWVLPAGGGLWLAGGTLYWIVVALEYVRTADIGATVRSATVSTFAGAVANVSDIPALLGDSLLYIGLNYPTPLVLAGLGGAWVLWRRRDGFSRVLLVLALVYFLWAARYKVLDQFSFFVPFYALASVMIGIGAEAIVRSRGVWSRWALVALALVPIVVYAALPEVVRRAGFVFFRRELPYRDPYTYFLRPWKCGDDSARRFAEETLAALPLGAVLMPAHTPAMPLRCVHDLEGMRPDVVLVDAYGVLLDPSTGRYWYGDENLLPELYEAGRRAFVVSAHSRYNPKWVTKFCRLEPFGLIFEVKPRAPGENS